MRRGFISYHCMMGFSFLCLECRLDTSNSILFEDEYGSTVFAKIDRPIVDGLLIGEAYMRKINLFCIFMINTLPNNCVGKFACIDFVWYGQGARHTLEEAAHAHNPWLGPHV
eukprot:c19870_g1_i2 orf=511-846(+)